MDRVCCVGDPSKRGALADPGVPYMEEMSRTAFSCELHFDVAGRGPVRLREGRCPGENGVIVSRLRVPARSHMRVTAPDHWIEFSLGGPTEIDCRIAGSRLFHVLQPGAMAVLPAGADAIAETGGPVEALMLRISRQRIVVGAAERGHLSAELMERLSGRDDALMRLATALFAEMRHGYVNGPLYWNEKADRVIDHLIENHSTSKPAAVGGSLSAATVTRLADYIRLHIAAPLDVASLAAVAGVSRYHFTRMFNRGVGMTPHRYVIKLRLEAATRLVRERRLPLAQVALETGFADQSHLSRWVQRVHGTTLARMQA